MLGWVDMVRERGWKDIARGTECEEAVLPPRSCLRRLEAVLVLYLLYCRTLDPSEERGSEAVSQVRDWHVLVCFL